MDKKCVIVENAVMAFKVAITSATPFSSMLDAGVMQHIHGP
jgi:pyruvate/2-oxoacid:ferredoxin oxidoreductase alpha subunit